MTKVNLWHVPPCYVACVTHTQIRYGTQLKTGMWHGYIMRCSYHCVSLQFSCNLKIRIIYHVGPPCSLGTPPPARPPVIRLIWWHSKRTVVVLLLGGLSCSVTIPPALSQHRYTVLEVPRKMAWWSPSRSGILIKVRNLVILTVKTGALLPGSWTPSYMAEVCRKCFNIPSSRF